MNNQTCKYCPSPAFSGTTPPLCEAHLDLAFLVEFLTDQGQAVTVESVQALIAQAHSNGGKLSIDADTAAALLTAEGGFAVSCRVRDA